MKQLIGQIFELSQPQDFGNYRKYESIPIVHEYANVSSEARGLTVGRNLHLHPYFMTASSEGFCESVHI